MIDFTFKGDSLLRSSQGSYLIDEVSNVAWVGHHRPDWVLGLSTYWPFIHPPHTRGLAQHMLHGFRLL